MYYLLFGFIPLLVLAFAAEQYVQYIFFKWGKVKNSAGLTGMQTAQQLSNDAGLGVRLATTNKKLGDHYEPATHTVCLSTQVAHESSVAALAVCAHELGHAQQKSDGSSLMRYREMLVPAIRLAPTASYVLLILGTITERFGLIWLGIGCFALTTVFMMLTLPVEFDASRRAFKLLEDSHLLSANDRRGARQVLTAAGLTYVVSSVFSVVQLVRYVVTRS